MVKDTLKGTSKLNIKDIEGKVKELKIELLKQPLKKRKVKKEIARLLTMNSQIKLGEKK